MCPLTPEANTPARHANDTSHHSREQPRWPGSHFTIRFFPTTSLDSLILGDSLTIGATAGRTSRIVPRGDTSPALVGHVHR